MAAITIVGTSHIAKESIVAVKKFIEEKKPEIVTIELDKNRLIALIKGKTENKISFKDMWRIGFTGYIFAIFGSWASNKLGKMVGSKPGDEMLAAVKCAKENNSKVYLIDRDIEITLVRFSQSITFREKMRFVGDVFRAVFFTKKEMKKMGLDETIDLRKVPPKKIIYVMINRLKERYPNVYKVLIHERNIHMAKALMKIRHDNPDSKILAVVGAGHEEGIMNFVKSKGKEA